MASENDAERLIKVSTDKQSDMARMLDLHPSRYETWPWEMIDRLIELENRGGRRKLLLELDSMRTPPPSKTR